MRLTDILVHVEATRQGQRRLALAVELAQRHGAHLGGLHVLDIEIPLAGGADAGGVVLVADLIEMSRRRATAAAEAAEASFREALRRSGVAGEWRLAEGAAPELVALHARYADLVVLGQEDPSGPASQAGAILERALFSSGRPVLVVPYAGQFESTGRRVLIGWNASREAARAVHDALPLIEAAEHATVFAVNPRPGLDGHGEQPGADIALHLARHGMKVRVEHAVAHDIPDADVILNRAAELSADLLVVGAYGHSRLREMVLGGVTRSLLRQMTVPVLMSH